MDVFFPFSWPKRAVYERSETLSAAAVYCKEEGKNNDVNVYSRLGRGRHIASNLLEGGCVCVKKESCCLSRCAQAYINGICTACVIMLK